MTKYRIYSNKRRVPLQIICHKDTSSKQIISKYDNSNLLEPYSSILTAPLL